MQNIIELMLRFDLGLDYVTMSHAATSQRFALLSVATFVVYIFAGLCLLVSKLPAVTTAESVHNSLLRAFKDFLIIYILLSKQID